MDAEGCAWTSPKFPRVVVTGMDIEVAGTLAALSAASGAVPREVDVAVLRARLREDGAILSD